MADDYLAFECEVIERLKERYFGRIERVFIKDDVLNPTYYNRTPIVIDHLIVFSILDDFCSATTIQFRRSEWNRYFKNGIPAEKLVDMMVERISKNLKQYVME